MMDIDGALRCPRCFSLWDEITCSTCGHQAAEKGETSGCHLAQETILQGRFLIGSVLGAGGFGITYAAWDLKLDIRVAIKEYFPSGLASRNTSLTDEVHTQPGEEDARAFAAGLNRFIRESRVLALFNTHADVVSVRDCIEENGTAYIIMEYLHGTNLQAYAATSGGRIPPKELMPLMRAPMEALGKIHEMSMLHRDVSPANLMLGSDNHVKLIDFGAAMDYVAGGGQNATMILNRRYAAPEQFQPNGVLGPWTDVYGICATLYTLLTGQTPWEASSGRASALPSIRGQGVNITRRQERAILRGLADNPKERIQSIPELLSPLYGVPLPEALRRRKRLSRIAIGAVSATLFVSLAVLINALWGFPGGDGAYYSLSPGGVALLRYEGDAAAFSTLDRFLGIPVTAIGSMAFHDNETLTEVSLGQSVSRVEAFAFAGCENLRAVWLPKSVLDIAPGAFDRCDERLVLYGTDGSCVAQHASENGLRFCDPSLFIVRVENGEAAVTGMTEYAADFYEEIVIPESLSSVPVTVIDTQDGYLPSVRRLVLPDTVRRIGAEALGWTVYNTANPRHELEEIILPSNLEAIEASAFATNGYRSLVIPETVTSIGAGVFHSCSELESIQLPSSLTSLGVRAFLGCSRLTDIRLPEGLTVIADSTFNKCYQLRSVSLPAGLRAIEKNAFESCRNLEEIVIPAGTQSIGDETFRGCARLSAAIIPASVTFIGEDAFTACSDDLIIYGFAGSAAQACANENGIRFADMGRWTPAEAFAYEITPDGVSITAYTGGLADVVMPDYIEGIAVTELASHLFVSDKSLRSVELPRMVTVLPFGCFSYCKSLVSVKLPESLRYIDAFAFDGCTSLPMLTIPSTLFDIHHGAALRDCPSLQTLVFEEGTRRIHWRAGDFINVIVIPESVTHISPTSFKWDDSAPTIRGVKGSYAETWAQQNGFAFEALR